MTGRTILAIPRNLILASLPTKDLNQIMERLEPIELVHKQVLFDPNKKIEFVYFVEEGVASIVNVFVDGTSVETATVGPEGMVGLAVFLDTDRSASQAFVQVTGRALRLPVDAFREMLGTMPALRRSLNRYTQALITLVSQSSACNRKHSIEERCARWLLTTQDRVGRDRFDLTQQFMAQMLGVRRASVTVAAGMLQKAGMIEYSRGHITVTNRVLLEQAACECYAVVRNEFARLITGDPSADPLSGAQGSRDGFSLTADAV